MKKNLLSLVWLSLTTLFFASCGDNLSKCKPNEEGFAKIEEALIKKFGSDAYYEGISVDYILSDYHDPEISLNVVVTNTPEKKQLQEWYFSDHRNWSQSAFVTLTLPKDENPVDYLYQLNDTFSLKRIGKMVEDASKVLSSEAKFDGALLKKAEMSTPDDDIASLTKVNITMTNKEKSSSYKLIYSLDGELLSWKKEGSDDSE